MGNSQSGGGGDCVLLSHEYEPEPERWRRIGIRLSIGPYMTGLRGALATMERKLHYFFFGGGYSTLYANYGADAPPWRGRHGPSSCSRGFCCAAYGEADSDPPHPPAGMVHSGVIDMDQSGGGGLESAFP